MAVRHGLCGWLTRPENASFEEALVAVQKYATGFTPAYLDALRAHLTYVRGEFAAPNIACTSLVTSVGM